MDWYVCQYQAADSFRSRFRITERAASALTDAGLASVDEVLATPRERLRRIKGVGPATVAHIEACKASGMSWAETDEDTRNRAIKAEGLKPKSRYTYR